MIAHNREALICDLAETYGIFDYKGLPVDTLATLCVGLREDSRIKTSLSGLPHTIQITLLMAIVDQLQILTWMHTDDGRHGRNRPKMLLALETRSPGGDITAYSTSAAFWQEREKLMRGE